jgi:hypothetical protein
MSQIEFEQTVQQWQRYGMTEDEWRTYEDEYADYLDTIQFTGLSLKQKIAVQNTREQELHEAKKQVALNKIREFRAGQRQKELDELHLSQ